MAARKISAETQHSGHAPKSEPEIKKNGRRSVKNGAPDRFRCGTIQKEGVRSAVDVRAARRILLLFYLA